jgi:uncharacterized GH25 family protein
MRASARAHSVLVAALLLAVGAGLSAHDFWLEPSTFEPKADEAIRIHLRLGQRFAGESLARNGAQIEKFVVVGPSGEKPVFGRDGMDPAGLLRLESPGLWFVGYRSKPSAVELAADKFEQYLVEEGLERIIQDRAARKESARPGREQFSRSVKSLLRSGATQGAQGFDRTLGLTLEFVLEADPARARAGRVPVRLLHDGRPLAGALVVAYRKEPGAFATAPAGLAPRPLNPTGPPVPSSTEMLRVRTDKDGRVVLPVTPGVWLLKAVHMERAAAESGADWSSVWTALTFQVPGVSADARKTPASSVGTPPPAPRR